MSNIGVDLKVKQGSMGMGGDKSKPRSGAAMGQGNGMGGFNGAAVNKAVAEVKGYHVKPSYYAGAGMGLKNK